MESGVYRNVTWTRYGWGLELVGRTDSGERVRVRYVGNGSERVTVRGSVADFRRYMAAGGR